MMFDKLIEDIDELKVHLMTLNDDSHTFAREVLGMENATDMAIDMGLLVAFVGTYTIYKTHAIENFAGSAQGKLTDIIGSLPFT